ncbi:hypothetical protein U3516DRAFT_619117 [Neocallimastix sp. 'constans']
MHSSTNYLYRRPSNASDSSSVTLTDDRCYGLTNSPESINPYSSCFNNNYDMNNYNSSHSIYNYMNQSYYNSNDEEYKNLPYTPSSYKSFSNTKNPLTINGNYEDNYNNLSYSYTDNNSYDSKYNNNSKYNYALGSSSYPIYNSTNHMNNYENNRRNLHHRSLSVGNSPSETYSYIHGNSNDRVYGDNSNIYITRSTSTPSSSRRHTRYNSGESFSNSLFKKNKYNHTNPIDYLDLPINSNDYYSRRRNRKYTKTLGDYYPEKKKTLLENITSKFKKLRFKLNDEKYDDYLQQLIKEPSTENNNGISSINNYYNNSNSNYISWNNYNNDSNFLIDTEPYRLRNTDSNLYSDQYSSNYNENSLFGRINPTLTRNHSRQNSFNNLYDNTYNNNSTHLYNTYNKKQKYINNDFYNNNVFVTNDNFTSDNDNVNKLNKYRRNSHRKLKSSLKEYVDTNYFNNNNYDGNPKYYKSKQSSKVTFDKNIQYWNPNEV